MKEMQNSFDSLVRIPDEFNASFSQRGWLAYESMSVKVMKQCIALAREDNVQQAEERLLEYCCPEMISFQISKAKNQDAFMHRWGQMQQALDEYQQERFYSCNNG